MVETQSKTAGDAADCAAGGEAKPARGRGFSAAVLDRFLNPIVLSAALLAVLIYTGVLNTAFRSSYRGLLPLDSVYSVSGTISSNISKVSSGRFYMFDISAESVRGRVSSHEITSGAAGVIHALVPTDLVESSLPGMLYSTSYDDASAEGAGRRARDSAAPRKDVIFERGERVTLTGRAWETFFIAENASPLPLSGGRLRTRITRFRSLCRLNFKRLMYNWGDAGGLVTALLSGSREYTDGDLTDAFRRAGLAHILALSGMHLSLFALLIGGMGRRAFGKKFEGVFSLFGILFFSWFAGLSPSLLRSLLCALIVRLCKTFYFNHPDFLRVLSFVFIVHCALFPQDTASLSFILSYGALFGLLVLGPGIDFVISRVIPEKLSAPLSASLGAQTAAAPVCLAVFRSTSLFGAVSSLIITPLVSTFLSFSVVAVALSFALPPLAAFFGGALNAIYKVIQAAVCFFACAPSVSI